MLGDTSSTRTGVLSWSSPSSQRKEQQQPRTTDTKSQKQTRGVEIQVLIKGGKAHSS